MHLRGGKDMGNSSWEPSRLKDGAEVSERRRLPNSSRGEEAPGRLRRTGPWRPRVRQGWSATHCGLGQHQAEQHPLQTEVQHLRRETQTVEEKRQLSETAAVPVQCAGETAGMGVHLPRLCVSGCSDSAQACWFWHSGLLGFKIKTIFRNYFLGGVWWHAVAAVEFCGFCAGDAQMAHLSPIKWERGGGSLHLQNFRLNSERLATLGSCHVGDSNPSHCARFSFTRRDVLRQRVWAFSTVPLWTAPRRVSASAKFTLQPGTGSWGRRGAEQVVVVPTPHRPIQSGRVQSFEKNSHMLGLGTLLGYCSTFCDALP